MSRILRRPMFRGGRVDSRGTGITSGLGYEKGGRVGYATGGDIMARLSNFFTKPALNPDGTPITLPQRNFVDDAAFLIGPGKFLKGAGGGLNLIRQMGKQPVFPPGYKAGFPKGMKSGELPQASFLSNKYFKDLISPYTSGAKEILKPIGTAAKEYTLPFGIGALLTGAAGKMGYDAFTSKGEDPDNEDAALLEAEEKLKREQEFRDYMAKLTENEKDTAKSKISGKEDIKESTKEYAEILGGDKATGKDVTDMLLSFAGKALKPEADVKSAFGEFFEAESKRPSRRDKIDQAAATLAINEYIAGKKSKAELDRFFAQADYQSALKSRTGKKNIPINITDAAKSFGTGYKAIDFGLKISFPESQTNKMDASEGQTVDKVPLTVDNIGQIFIEDEAPYSAVMITIEDGKLIRDPLN